MPKRARAQETPAVVKMIIRIPADVHADAVENAKADERSLNLYVVRAIRDANEAAKKGRR